MPLFGGWIAAVDEDGAEKALLEKVQGRVASATTMPRFGVRHPCENPWLQPNNWNVFRKRGAKSMVALKVEGGFLLCGYLQPHRS